MEAIRDLTEQEALFVACEMEASAVALYTRAILLMEQLGRDGEPLYAQLRLTLADEKEHLKRFRSLFTGLDTSEERQAALATIAQDVLFAGGLMGAAREGLLRDADSMLRFAMRSEEISAQTYRQFAANSKSASARETLELIAAEEDRHLGDLRLQAGLTNED